MNKILLVGATGQLGTAVFRKLTDLHKAPIRIMVREDSDYEHLKNGNPEVVLGDLKNEEEVFNAVKDCGYVITTANAAAPRKKEDTFKAVDIEGYRYLIDAAKAYEVKQFIYTSAPLLPKKWNRWLPLGRAKLETEDYLKASGLDYTIFRPDAFMDIYFAFLGTSIPLRNVEAHLIHRPFKFVQNFYEGIKDNIDNGVIGIVGRGDVPHTYIALDNVADFIVGAWKNSHLYNRTLSLGGPEALTPMQVKEIFEKVLQRPLRTKRTPAFLLRLMGAAMAWFNEGASNLLKLNYVSAKFPSNHDCKELAEKLGIHLISAEEYLHRKLAEPTKAAH